MVIYKTRPITLSNFGHATEVLIEVYLLVLDWATTGQNGTGRRGGDGSVIGLDKDGSWASNV